MYVCVFAFYVYMFGYTDVSTEHRRLEHIQMFLALGSFVRALIDSLRRRLLRRCRHSEIDPTKFHRNPIRSGLFSRTSRKTNQSANQSPCSENTYHTLSLLLTSSVGCFRVHMWELYMYTRTQMRHQI